MRLEIEAKKWIQCKLKWAMQQHKEVVVVNQPQTVAQRLNRNGEKRAGVELQKGLMVLESVL
jgi:hypothetical protein